MEGRTSVVIAHHLDTIRTRTRSWSSRTARSRSRARRTRRPRRRLRGAVISDGRTCRGNFVPTPVHKQRQPNSREQSTTRKAFNDGGSWPTGHRYADAAGQWPRPSAHGVVTQANDRVAGWPTLRPTECAQPQTRSRERPRGHVRECRKFCSQISRPVPDRRGRGWFLRRPRHSKVTLNAALQAAVQAIPEAGWLVLLGFGLLALATRSRRRPGAPPGGSAGGISTTGLTST